MTAIDTTPMPRQYGCAGVNPPASFSRLDKQQGRQAAYQYLSGIFTSVYHATSAPFYGGQWQGGFMPTGLVASTANLAICLPPTRLAALSGLYRPTRKGHIMPKIRKAFSRPIYAHKLRSFATFEEACNMVDSLTTRNSDFYRFLIEQTATGWTVSRIAQGSAA